MAVDIGPRIGIDGEKEFRQALNNINQQLRTLGSEMKAVTSAFDENDKSQEALSAQTDVLNRQIDAQEQKLSQLQRGLDASAKKYGENDTKTMRWAQAVNDATADLNKMRSQLTRTEREMDNLGDSTDDTADSMDDLGGASGGLISGLADVKAGFDMVGGVISGVISGTVDLVKSFFELADATEEYRIAQGKLNTAFEAAGYSTSTASAAYKDLYAIIGDTDTATEAAQLLAKLSNNAADMSTWINIAAGVAGTFGDALPLNSLIEAANETARVGTVTGVLADALNWASISEDDFNVALADCTTEADRNQLIMDTLAGTYDTAADAFYKNNEQMVLARENQAALDESMAVLGSTVQDLKNRLLSDFIPALGGVVEAFSDVVAGSDGAEQELSQKIEDLILKFNEKMPEYTDLGVRIMDAVGTGIIDNADVLVDAFEQSYEANVEQVRSLGQSLFKKVGESIADGLSEGFTVKWNRFIQGLTVTSGPIGTAITAIKQALGIHSPSTVFAGIGENMALGLAEGWDTTMADVSSQMQRAIPTSADQMSGIAAGMVNGVQTAMTGAGGTYRLEIPLIVNGREFYRATIGDLRSVMKADPEVLSGVTP